MITVKQATKNIYQIASEAQPIHWAEGGAWYSEANAYCQMLARSYGTSLAKVVGVLAVLSPQCAWETNKLATKDLLETGSTSRQCYPDNIAKAQRILHGESFHSVMNHKRYGLKVRAFYDNILHVETSQAVTVDTHAIRAAFNLTDLTRTQIRWVFEGGGNKVLQDAYRNAAACYNLQPLKLQATVWLAVKERLEE